ncbi:MAG: Hsp20/alpha crystallin family protein [Methylococcaceae bacterium]|nr:Hsp20/alpha crystallin family protein [Methylococcaceae bacterium]
MTDKETQVTVTNKDLQTPHRPSALTAFDEMDRWFDDVFPRNWMQPFFRRGWPDLETAFGGKTPRVDVIDRETEVVVRAELPGVAKEDLEVSLSDNLLTITARTRHEETEEKGRYHRREITSGEFRRSVRLPADVEGEQTKASFKDGVLELVAPKMAAAVRHTIKVE